MKPEAVKARLLDALHILVERDSYLFENNLSERCITARLAMYLQNAFQEFSVDVEYNRKGHEPKALKKLPQECGKQTKDGEFLVFPDIIVHRRGPEGPNLLAIELKKTTNPERDSCFQVPPQDSWFQVPKFVVSGSRIRAFRCRTSWFQVRDIENP